MHIYKLYINYNNFELSVTIKKKKSNNNKNSFAHNMPINVQNVYKQLNICIYI